MPKNKITDNLLLLVLISAGLILRLFLIGKNDFWYDEVFTKDAPISTYAIMRLPNFFFLYTKFIAVWTQHFRASEVTLRLPSALFSAISIALTYGIAKKLFGKQTALIAAAFMAFSPFQLWYAQEAKNYTLVLFLGLLTSAFLINLRDRIRFKELLFYYFSFSLLIFSHYLGIFLLLVQIFYLFFTKKERPLKAAVLLLPLLLVPIWIFFSLGEIRFISSGFWIPRPDMKSLGVTFENFILGYNGTWFLYLLVDLLFLFLLAIGTPLFKAEKRNEMLFCLFSFALPLALVFIFSKYFVSLYLDRSFLLFTPYFYIFFAFIISRIRTVALKSSLLAALIITMLFCDARYYLNQVYLPNDPKHHIGTYIKKPFRPLARFLKQNFKDGDLLVFGHLAPMPPLSVYFTSEDRNKFFSIYYYVFDPEIMDSTARRASSIVYKSFKRFVRKDEVPETFKDTKGRLFFMGCDWPRSGKLDDNSMSVKKELGRYYQLTETLTFDGIILCIYKPKGTT